MQLCSKAQLYLTGGKWICVVLVECPFKCCACCSEASEDFAGNISLKSSKYSLRERNKNMTRDKCWYFWFTESQFGSLSITQWRLLHVSDSPFNPLMPICVKNKWRLTASWWWQRCPRLITTRSDEITVVLTALSSWGLTHTPQQTLTQLLTNQSTNTHQNDYVLSQMCLENQKDTH